MKKQAKDTPKRSVGRPRDYDWGGEPLVKNSRKYPASIWEALKHPQFRRMVHQGAVQFLKLMKEPTP
jgi:hypothetical protein